VNKVALSICVGSVLFASRLALADFINLTAEPFVGKGWIENGFEGLTAWRIYANFDGHGDDGVISVYGIQGVPLSMASTDGNFHNAEIDSMCAPQDFTGEGFWDNQWDSYVTIGRTTSDGICACLNQEMNCLQGDFETENGGWFTTPDDDDSCAEDGRLLLGQIVVAKGENISGTLNLFLKDGNQIEREQLNSTSCLADLDGSGAVDFGDILTVLAAWGNIGGPEDLDGSGTVDFGDLLIVLANWGPCK